MAKMQHHVSSRTGRSVYLCEQEHSARMAWRRLEATSRRIAREEAGTPTC